MKPIAGYWKSFAMPLGLEKCTNVGLFILHRGTLCHYKSYMYKLVFTVLKGNSIEKLNKAGNFILDMHFCICMVLNAFKNMFYKEKRNYKKNHDSSNMIHVIHSCNLSYIVSNYECN